jgi:hypothetical protein
MSSESGPLVPPTLLFQFCIPVRHRARMPGRGQRLIPRLDKSYCLPFLGELDGARQLFDLRAAWNARGLGFIATIPQASREPVRRPDAPGNSDGLQLWIDTRDTKTIHRASRFCHHFVVWPPTNDAPAAIQQVEIARSREDVTLARSAEMRVISQWSGDDLELQVWLPAEVLSGYDPELNPRLGFFATCRDRRLGEQQLTLDRDFPFDNDPSLWSSLELLPG